MVRVMVMGGVCGESHWEGWSPEGVVRDNCDCVEC